MNQDNLIKILIGVYFVGVGIYGNPESLIDAIRQSKGFAKFAVAYWILITISAPLGNVGKQLKYLVFLAVLLESQANGSINILTEKLKDLQQIK
jgi:hypothetical protein